MFPLNRNIFVGVAVILIAACCCYFYEEALERASFESPPPEGHLGVYVRILWPSVEDSMIASNVARSLEGSSYIVPAVIYSPGKKVTRIRINRLIATLNVTYFPDYVESRFANAMPGKNYEITYLNADGVVGKWSPVPSRLPEQYKELIRK